MPTRCSRNEARVLVRRRRLHATLTSVGVLATILIGAMWLRSHFVVDAVFAPTGRSGLTNLDFIESGSGYLRYRRMRIPFQYASGWARTSGVTFQRRPVRSPTSVFGIHGTTGAQLTSILGFGLLHGNYDPTLRYGTGMPYMMIVVPYWSIALLSVLLTSVEWRRLTSACRRLHASRSHLCALCGYDTRANDRVCSECGTDKGTSCAGKAGEV